MEKQASGLISLDSLDAKSGARAICRYSVGAKCDARITAQLPDEAKYIAIIWACERPIVLGELKKTNTGWEVQGEFESECVDACFIAMKTPSDLNAILCGKAMGAKVDMDKALFKLRLLSDKSKAQAPQRYSAAETPFSEKAKAAIQDYMAGLCAGKRPNEFVGLFDRLFDDIPATAAELYARLHFSSKQTERLFLKNFGLPPRVVLSILRFQKCLRVLAGGSAAPADILNLVNFYDQAHFINDFKRNLGLTPFELVLRYK